MIETSKPYSDGWWLAKLYAQLRAQQKHCEGLRNRYEGDSPLPTLTASQNAAVKWFVEKCRGNYELMICRAVESRIKLAGVRTAADTDDDGDQLAYEIWRKSRGKLWTSQVIEHMTAMGRGYLIFGKDEEGELLVTAEDPRFVTAITDPANPYKTLAALKLYHDDVYDMDVALLYMAGRLRVATRPRKARMISDVTFSPSAYSWDDDDIFNEAGEMVHVARSGPIAGLEAHDGLPARNPVVELVNKGGKAQFEWFQNIIDRIHQKFLSEMTTIAIQAFRQRAFKGLPTHDKEGVLIDWNAIFIADPGAIWNVPKEVEIQELAQADFSSILLSIRDTVQELCAASGTPLYTVTPDAAQGSAEGASLQKENNMAIVSGFIDIIEPGFDLGFELIFRTLGDTERQAPGTVQCIWSPINQPSMGERANAIAQTVNVLSRYNQSTLIWGMTPTEAQRNLSELDGDFLINQQYGIGAAKAAALLPPARNALPAASDVNAA